MPSIGNKAKLVTSEICQKCGKCCKEFSMLDNLDNALRFLWIDNKKIKVKDTPFQLPFNQGIERSICFKFPCSQLKFKDGKYYCKVWKEERPDFCNTYPDHIFYSCETWNKEKIQKILEFESENCPALKNITVDDVIKMLNEIRGDIKA